MQNFSDADSIGALQNRILLLEQENFLLKSKLAFFEAHPTIKQGISGETLIADLLQGSFAAKNANHDIVLKKGKIKIEVKFSNLNLAVSNSTTRRWAWAKIFGESGKKCYDRLLLVGDADPRWRHLYLDAECPYVFFDLSLEEALPYSNQSGRFRSIYLTTNPAKARSVSAPLFTRHQISISSLTARYQFANTAEQDAAANP